MRAFKKNKEIYHINCETRNCINYYNAQHKDVNGKCKPCNIAEKKKKNNG